VGVSQKVKLSGWWNKRKDFPPVEGTNLTMSELTEMSKPTTTQASPKSSQTMDANDLQIGGTHYKRCAIQPWDYIAANDLDYFQGTIIKYITRWSAKGGVEDLEKARHFLDKYIEVMKGN
jgi:hypothetical protein